jgi:hypothetical protein
MAELSALISWLTAFYLFVLEWDEKRDGEELSRLLTLYLGGAVRLFHDEMGDIKLGLSNLWKKLSRR